MESYSKANSGLKKCEVITNECLNKEGSDVVEIYASIIKSPTSFMSDRLVIDAKYLWPEENLVIFSSLGN